MKMKGQPLVDVFYTDSNAGGKSHDLWFDYFNGNLYLFVKIL
jgi:hypothetical protein